MLALRLLRRLRSLRACWRRLRIIVVKGPALRWMKTKRYIDKQVVNNSNNNYNRKRLN